MPKIIRNSVGGGGGVASRQLIGDIFCRRQHAECVFIAATERIRRRRQVRGVCEGARYTSPVSRRVLRLQFLPMHSCNEPVLGDGTGGQMVYRNGTPQGRGVSGKLPGWAGSCRCATATVCEILKKGFLFLSFKMRKRVAGGTAAQLRPLSLATTGGEGMGRQQDPRHPVHTDASPRVGAPPPAPRLNALKFHCV